MLHSSRGSEFAYPVKNLTAQDSTTVGFPNSLKWDLSRSAAKLKQLAGLLKGAKRGKVLILCHNNPDPDSIAGAFAFSHLLSKEFSIRSVVGYGGVITRAENKAMVQRLRIKMKQLAKLDPSKYHAIALMDAQPGTGNNLLDARHAPPLIVIDHHPLRKASLKAPFNDVRPRYGATSTIVTEYLAAAGIMPGRSVANALLYGIKTDTNSLLRGACKADFTAFQYLSPLTNPRMIAWIEKPCLSQEYFADYAHGLSRTNLYRDVAVCDLGKIRSEAIIPELGDLLLRTEGISWSFCMGEVKNLLILSMRSTSRTRRAGDIIRRLVGKQGAAGGHKEMAGGQISICGFSDADKKGLRQKLVAKFLKLVQRDCVHPKPLAEKSDSPHG